LLIIGNRSPNPATVLLTN